MKKAIILHNPVSPSANEDEKDVLHQAELIEDALNGSGFETSRMDFDMNLHFMMHNLHCQQPSVVFNLVETVMNQGRLNFLAPALLETLKIPFTGSGANTIYLTTDKVLTKQLLRFHHLLTPDWFNNTAQPDPDKRYILKPVSEDGSVGIEEDFVKAGKDIHILPDNYFIEEYIHGREFNISILGGKNGPDVLAPAEMQFNNYPEFKPKVLGYKAKWKENSFEYKNTVRTFDVQEDDRNLLLQMEQMTKKCWKVFGLKGYARVDFRVDLNNQPSIIEINANPCIAPDSGFIAACHHAGLSNKEIIQRILEDAFEAI
jgi:D-alanine-D-alanine ligase